MPVAPSPSQQIAVWQGMQVAVAEVLLLAYPEVHSIYLRDSDNQFNAYILLATAMSQDDQSGIVHLLREVIEVGTEGSFTLIGCQFGLAVPEIGGYRLLISPDTLATLPEEIAPWRHINNFGT